MAGEFERLARETPADARRALGRIAEGNLSRVYAPSLESLGRRLSRDIERLTGAIASAALVIAGSMLVGLGGWRGLLGAAITFVGLLGVFLVAFGAWRKPRDRR